MIQTFSWPPEVGGHRHGLGEVVSLTSKHTYIVGPRLRIFLKYTM